MNCVSVFSYLNYGGESSHKTVPVRYILKALLDMTNSRRYPLRRPHFDDTCFLVYRIFVVIKCVCAVVDVNCTLSIYTDLFGKQSISLSV